MLVPSVCRCDGALMWALIRALPDMEAGLEVGLREMRISRHSIYPKVYDIPKNNDVGTHDVNCGAMNRKLAKKGKRVSTVFMRSMIAQQRSLKKPEAVSVAGQPCLDIIVSDPSRKRFHCHEVCLYKKLVQKMAQGQMEVFCQFLTCIYFI